MRHEVIVIGGGIAGLQCARDLRRAGRDVVVLDQARDVGGRCATRRFEGQPIDFGPVFLHGHVPAFLQALMDVEGAVLHSPWPRRIEGQGQPCQPGAFEADEQRAVIPGGMDLFARHLARDLDVRLRARATGLARDAQGFTISTEGGEVFESRDLVLALALEETRDLLATLPSAPELASVRTLLGMFASVPSLTVLAAYPADAPAPEWDILYPSESDSLQLVSQDSRKRENPAYLTLVFQARPRWSRERLEQPEESWAAELLAEATACVGPWVREPLWMSSHRWRFARVDRGNELARPLLARSGRGPRLGLAGDVFAPGGGVQAAWLSGAALAHRLLTEE